MSKTKRAPLVLNNYEQAALLGQPNPKAPTGLRNLCILSLMINTGLRVNEVIALKSEDINWKEGYIDIKGSGAAKARTLWLADAERSLLQRWSDVKPSDSNLLFCTLDGNCLKDRYIREMVKRLARKAGIAKDIYPHVLRYTFAFNLIRETGEIELLQEALGHRDQSATKQYVSYFSHDFIVQEGDTNVKRSGIPVQIKAADAAQSDKEKGRAPLHTSLQGIVNQKLCAQPNAELFGKKETTAAVKKDLRPLDGAKANKPDKPQDIIKQRDQTATKASTDYRAGSAVNRGNVNTVKKEKTDYGSEQTNHSAEIIKKVPIPALKCSNCDYILRYQGDCPKCGAKFNDILRHWGKNV